MEGKMMRILVAAFFMATALTPSRAQTATAAADWQTPKAFTQDLTASKITEAESWLNACAPDSAQDIQAIFVQHARGANTAGGDYDTYLFCRPGRGWLGKLSLKKRGWGAARDPKIEQNTVQANLKLGKVVKILGYYHGQDDDVVFYIEKL
jgi:hypothetical protein